mgnify:FL=1
MKKKYYRTNNDFENYWWINSSLMEISSPEINISVANKFRSYGPLKASVWFWFRQKVVSRTDLAARDKLCAWAICERFKGQSFSTWDSLTYIGKMTGTSRKTVSKAIQKLIEKELRGIAIEGKERKGVRTLPQAHIKKHFLLCGLNQILAQEINKNDKQKVGP